MSEREDRLIDRLGSPLASERVAADRNWLAIQALSRTAARRGTGLLRTAVATLAVLTIVAIGAATWGSVRLQVGANHLPVLYRQEIARTELAAAGVRASLAIEQQPAAHRSTPAAPEIVGLFVSALVDVRIAAEALPADIELRFQRPEWASYGILARSEGLNEPRRATGETHTTYRAPFPPSPAGETATYRVWLHLDTATGPLDSRVLVIAVDGRPEGQRAVAVADLPPPSGAPQVACARSGDPAVGRAITVCPAAGPIGSTVTIQGTACGYPGAPAIIYFGRELATGDGLSPGAVEVGRFSADAAGRFTATFRIPTELGTIQGGGGGPVRAGPYFFYSKPSAFCEAPFTVVDR